MSTIIFVGNILNAIYLEHNKPITKKNMFNHYMALLDHNGGHHPHAMMKWSDTDHRIVAHSGRWTCGNL